MCRCGGVLIVSCHVVLCCAVCYPQVWLTIQRPGVFYGQCSELCGANHAFMPIVVEAVTPRQVGFGGRGGGEPG